MDFGPNSETASRFGETLPEVDQQDTRHSELGEPPKSISMSYYRFGAMILTSGLAVFALMYLNTYELSDVKWSETRFYMALLMVAVMAAIMLAFMFSMYRDRRINVAILAVSALVFSGALWLVRSQNTVQDASWMRAMIPHHSIAILTSERADISDVRVCDLAVDIIEAQKREIEEMNWLIDDIVMNDQPRIDPRPPRDLLPSLLVPVNESVRKYVDRPVGAAPRKERGNHSDRVIASSSWPCAHGPQSGVIGIWLTPIRHAAAERPIVLSGGSSATSRARVLGAARKIA